MSGYLKSSFHADFLPLERLLIKWTMKNIEEKSCIKFVKRTNEEDYIKIVYDSIK